MQDKVFIYVPKITKRIKYIFSLVLTDIIGLHEFELTADEELFNAYEGYKFSYAKDPVGASYFLAAHPILFNTGIVEYQVLTGDYEGEKVLFKHKDQRSFLPYDCFAAAFYMAARYEEYLPFIEDSHGRFMPKYSIAYQQRFLTKPIVHFWALQLASVLKRMFPTIMFKQRQYKFVPTFDVDLAYAYRLKGPVRTIAGYLRSMWEMQWDEVVKRSKVLLFLEKDPFDTYDDILTLHRKYGIKPLFFFLYGAYGLYDKNVPTHNKKFQSLIKYLGDYTEIGSHPSYNSFYDGATLQKEIEELSDVLKKDITKNRQHFLKFVLPDTYRKLIKNDITDDYSMGYASEPGFRAGLCIPYLFYDIDLELTTPLKLHPFAFMDGTFCDYKHNNADEVFALVKPMIQQVKQVKGTLYTVWHNEAFSDAKRWKGWRKLYEDIVKEAML